MAMGLGGFLATKATLSRYASELKRALVIPKSTGNPFRRVWRALPCKALNYVKKVEKRRVKRQGNENGDDTITIAGKGSLKPYDIGAARTWCTDPLPFSADNSIKNRLQMPCHA
jgi:hypothetical protein